MGGTLRKTGDGELNSCTRWVEDLPGPKHECKKKPPMKNLPIAPKAKKEDEAEDKPKKPEHKKPNVPTPHTTPKNPKAGPAKPPKKPDPKRREKKDKTKTPEQIRKQNDEDYMNKLMAQREVHQVITMKKKYQWLDDP